MRSLAFFCLSFLFFYLFVAERVATGQTTEWRYEDYDYNNNPGSCDREPTVIPSHFVPFGPDVGDQVAPPNDDGSLGPLALLEPFKFFDETHSQVYINTNGGVTFAYALGTYIPDHFPILSNPYDIIVAYWADIDTNRNHGRIYYRQTTDRTVLENVRHLQRLPSSGDFSALVATWHNVTYFGGNTCTEVNTFQIVLVTSGTASFAVLNYAQLGWVLSATSTTAQAGYNSASSGRYYELPGAMSTFPNTFLTASNVNVPGQWVFRVDGGSDDLCQGFSNMESLNATEDYPTLDPCLVNLVGPVVENTYIVFRCRVQLTTPDPEARAEVTFLFDGEASSSVPAVVVTPSTDPDVELHERHLYNNMGKSVQCSVSTFFVSTPDIRGPQTYSDSYYVGIQSPDNLILLDPQIDVSIVTTLYTSLPIICAGDLSSSSCHLELRLTTSENLVLQTSFDSCSYEIEANDWDNNTQRAHNSANKLQIRISPLSIPVTRGLETISVSLHPSSEGLHPSNRQDENSHSYNNIWRSEKLGEIQVTRASGRAAMCMSTGDPQMQSFDGLFFSVQQKGIYLMVESKSPRVFRVEIRHWACVKGQSGCSIGCAVAVREGNVAYGLDMCNGRKTIHRLRLSPQSLSYEPITADPSRTRWTITMPSGASVQVYIRTWGRGGMNVYVNVPSRDRNQTMGLCGTFDGDPRNDFTKADGTVVPFDDYHWTDDTRRDVNKFIKSYKIPPGDSLFQTFEEVEGLPSDEDFCACHQEDISTCGPEVNNPTLSVAANTIGDGTQQETAANRIRRDTSDQEPERTDNVDDAYVFGPVEEDDSNPAPQGWPTWNNVTQQQAQDYCSGVLRGNVPSACTPVIDNAALENIIGSCMDDVELTGELIWAEDKIASVQELCTFTVQNAPESADLDQSVIASQLAAITSEVCPNQCSGQGTCHNAQCQCNPDFVGPDCSIAAGQAPEILEILSTTTCDIAERLCESVRLLADNMVISSTIECKVDMTLMDGSELTTQSPGVAVSYNEVECPLSSLYTIDAGSGPAPFYRYKISLSNDGVIFSPQLSVPGAPMGAVVYDSSCIQCSEEGICTQLDGTCIVAGQCQLVQDYSDDQTCESATTESDETYLYIVIGCVVGGVVLIVVVVVVVVSVSKSTQSKPDHRRKLSTVSRGNSVSPFGSGTMPEMYYGGPKGV